MWNKNVFNYTINDSEYIKQLNCILQDVIHILSKCFNNAHFLHGNLFLYDACFAYKFELKSNSQTTTMIAIGYFTSIFQSPRFVDSFVELRKGLGVLKSYNKNERAYHILQKCTNEVLAKMMKAKGDKLAELKDRNKLHTKLLVQAKHAMDGTEAPPFVLD